MNLDELRKKIDDVDSRIVKLFLERMEYVEEVGKYKIENNLPVRFPERENQIIKDKTKNINKFKSETSDFFKSLIEISCNYQEKQMNKIKVKPIEFTKMSMKEYLDSINCICYQGILGSYSYEAAKNLFGEKSLKDVKTFKEVCQNVDMGLCEAGILPIENLSAGSISEVYDLIEEYNLNIIYATDLKINHCLLGLGELSDIKAVKSHPQALSQCSRFIDKNGFEKIKSLNTAIAANEVSLNKDKSVGAICNKINAEYYGLKVLCENISDINDNQTRFIIISKKKIIIDNPSKISIVFSLPHQIGSLSRALNDFARNDLNLTKIESRPLKSNKWEYLFFVDIEGSLLDNNIKEHLEDIGFLFNYFRVIGNY